jgi:demethylmenaquinone methyltransferase/2-methoxy-6-polyprenyl-1,4-benzoquinol methylase
VDRALAGFGPRGNVLELACGTGLWTARLVTWADHVTAVDAAPEMLALNRARLGTNAVSYVEADLFAWEPPAGAFDVVFFAFWLSHVPLERFDAMWELVRRALRPGGRFFLVDSRRESSSTALDHVLPESASTTLTRRLNDGREFEIYKLFYTTDALQRRLERLGWSATVRETPTFFLHASGSRAERR